MIEPHIPNLMLVDDNEVDRILYERTIRKSGAVGALHPFFMAEDALAFLKTESAPKIDVILLDINMPRMTGLEFLERAHSELASQIEDICVFMLTTSMDPRDVQRAQQFSCVRGYFVKPLTVEQLGHIADLVHAKQHKTAR